MKAHLVQSAEPLKEGEDRQVLCGRTVVKSQFPFIWDEMSMGQLNLSSLRCCRSCIESLDDRNCRELYVYGVVEGQESMEAQ